MANLQSTVFGIPWPEANDGLCYKDTVKESNAGFTLLDFYCSKYQSSAPKKGWIQRIQNGQITVDGIVLKDPYTILRANSRLVYHRIPWTEPSAPHQLTLLYEDDHVVLPGGLFQQRTVLIQLMWKYKQSPHYVDMENKHSYQESQPVPVHRLGRGTSGILLCAKSKIAKSRLATDFADGTESIYRKRCCNFSHHSSERRISKTYRALAQGLIEQDRIIVSQPIGKIRYAGVASGLYVASSSGKPAESRVSVLHRDVKENCTLVEVEIYSGRPHQIRIHMAYIGHPLVGDPLYVCGGQPLLPPNGSPCDGTRGDDIERDGGYQRSQHSMPGDCGYHLHAYRLSFHHPISNEVMEVVACPPPILSLPNEIMTNQQ
eukprot:TRINITY_DN23848_c0_g1_i1.p1 TRINITY_DN23848_c0_g1~~TRINITY_DN23848_c0_g1_i1.p1  ORF type:complete len:374 (+),score=55.30 TRINITY_DN23848_c0_g1_i1:183-1304(+)